MAPYIIPATAEQEEWGVIRTKIITKLDGTKITTKFAPFVEVHYEIALTSSTIISQILDITKDACGAHCINSVKRCLFYRMEFDDSLRIKGDCYLFSHLAKAEENKYSYSYFNPSFFKNNERRFYEIKVRIFE